MGIVKEPLNVELTVINRELSEEEQKKISAYIRKDKQKRKAQNPLVTGVDRKDSST